MKTNISICCLILIASLGCQGVKQPVQNVDKTARFAGTWGVMFHYLAIPAGTTGSYDAYGEITKPETAETWNEKINAFDVEGLANQLEAVGADYFLITLGQGSGLLLAQNEVYDELTGFDPPKSAARDLVSDLSEVLKPRGMKMILYTASELGWADLEMREKLRMTNHHNDHRLGLRDPETPNDWQANRDGQAEYLGYWMQIHEHWSKKWGTKVDGWWVDGCYGRDIRFPENEAPNLRTMRAALLAGNPDAIVTFNGGRGIYIHSAHEDYTAGEISSGLPECSGPWVEEGREGQSMGGQRSRFHTMTYLGSTWGLGDAPRYTDEEVVAFAAGITSQGGFVTFDVPPQANGLIPEAFMAQLKRIGDAVEQAR